MSTPWVVDADYFDPDSDLVIEQTPPIREFLSAGSRKFAVSATKGYGKTLLLNAKRHSLPDGFAAIPAGSVLDRPSGDRVFSADEISQLSQSHEPWTKIWRASIAAAVVKKFELVEIEHLKSPLGGLIDRSHLHSSIDFFLNILDMNPSQLFKIASDTDQVLVPSLRSLSAPVAVFVDSVDEFFGKHLIRANAERLTAGEISPRIWTLAQIGLFTAAWDLRRVTHQLKIFITIRKEAIAELDDDPMQQQYEGGTVDLTYSMESLKRIFEANIKLETKDNLVLPKELRDDPTVALVGAHPLKHVYAYEREDPFAYIYRHTLKRPRDLMTIGGAISAIPPAERNGSRIMEAINDAGTNIAKEYLAEISPLLGDADLPLLWRLAPQPALTTSALTDTMQNYTNHTKSRASVTGAELVAMLYRAGLIGIVRRTLTETGVVQRFEAPGTLRINSEEALPDAYWYLFHPSLSHIISQENAGYLRDRDRINVIGDNRPWVEETEVGDTEEVYVLRGDIVNFSRYISMSAPAETAIREALNVAMARHAKGMRFWEVTDGDSLTAISDDADHIVRVAKRVQEELHLAPDQPQLRICVVRGEVLLSNTEDGTTVIRGGSALKMAARVERVVRPNRVWVDAATRETLEQQRSFYTTRDISDVDDSAPNGDGAIDVSKTEHGEGPIWVHLYEVVQR